MLRATSVIAAGHWRADTADVVVLDFDDRHRRRVVMEGVRGLSFLLDLPAAAALRGGDALRLEDGRLVEVVAAPEPLAEIRAPDAAALVRIAWHLGNRHLPTQLLGSRLRIRRDHVIEEMARGLGGRVAAIEAPFDPEGGAYAGGHGRGGQADHDHGHDGEHHDHDHGQRHGHEAHHHEHGHGHAGATPGKGR
jgi:urease accessory protein